MSLAWLWLLFSIIGSSFGNVLMKAASQRGDGIFEVFFSLPFIVGASLFGGGLICYMKALHTLPLAVAYPTVVGVSMVAISGMAVVFFHERISFGHTVGALLIFAGVVLLARNSSLS